jgi:hypothetical protein
MRNIRGLLSVLLSVFGRSDIFAGICAGLIISLGMLVIVKANGVGAAWPKGLSPAVFAHSSVPQQGFADLRGENASADVRYLADWIADSHDAAGSAFVIIDKKDAKVYVFDGDARLRGAAPVLLGGARGDDSIPGIGLRPINEVLPEERTTPAGRFVGERGHNARGEDVVWVDYDAAVSMHRVLTTNPEERRLERLATPTNEDNRISYGCINVPVAFFEAYVQPAFARQRAIVYVLPEFKSLDEVFGSYDVASSLRRVLPDHAQRASGRDEVVTHPAHRSAL